MTKINSDNAFLSDYLNGIRNYFMTILDSANYTVLVENNVTLDSILLSIQSFVKVM